MRATEADIITRNGGTNRTPDETLVNELKTLAGIVDTHPYLMPIYVDYVRAMQAGHGADARVAKAFILSYAHV